LIDWIFEIGDKLQQSNLTIHIAAAYIDSVLHKAEVPGDQLHLYALTSLLLACKYYSNFNS
jgi:hypothetical protein